MQEFGEWERGRVCCGPQRESRWRPDIGSGHLVIADEGMEWARGEQQVSEWLTQPPGITHRGHRVFSARLGSEV